MTKVAVFGDRFHHKVIVGVRATASGDLHFAARHRSFEDTTGAPFLARTINAAVDDANCASDFPNPKGKDADLEVVDTYDYFPKFEGDAGKDRVLRRAARFISYPEKSKPAEIKATPAGEPIVAHLDYGSSSFDGADVKSAYTRCKLAICCLGSDVKSARVANYERLLSENRDARHSIFVSKLKNLSASGVEISEDTSLEKLIEDVSTYFGDKTKRSGQSVELCKRLRELYDHLILISDNFVVHIDSRQPAESWLHFLPNFARPAFGKMPNELGVYVASITSSMIAATASEPKAPQFRPVAADALRRALLAASYAYETGIPEIKIDEDRTPFDVLANVLHPARFLAKEDEAAKKTHGIGNELGVAIANDKGKFDRYRFVSANFALGDGWKRTQVYKAGATEDHLDIEKVCRKIVRLGVNAAGRNDGAPVDGAGPRATIACPYASIGKLKLINSDEITQFMNCSRIIKKYLSDQSWRKPLSIGLFGKPGSGKSFAVSQLVDANRGGASPRPLIFNLAQISSIDQLTECFHAVQSEVLSSRDEPPLVMFDEFDSEFENSPLGLLKYFLAPMQDGEFRGKSGTYKIGRAIFAFAGGVYDTFANFQAGKNADSDKKLDEAELKKAKQPDFISRLHGHVNIRDLDTYGDNGKLADRIRYDATYTDLLLRRAMSLRTILELNAKDILVNDHGIGEAAANIDDDVIDELLLTKTYKFGMRSMEAIVRASHFVDDRFVRASFPPSDQTKHHIERE